MRAETIDPLISRANFERNIYIAIENVENGRLHLLPQMIENFIKVRRLPNNRIDLLSVDEMVRLTANTTQHMHRMATYANDTETKK